MTYCTSLPLTLSSLTSDHRQHVLEEQPLLSLYDVFATISDPRSKHGRRYELAYVLICLVAGLLCLQVVDPQQLAHQLLLKSKPVNVIGKQAQEICQPIIGQITLTHGDHPASLQGFHSSPRPLLHPIHPMIGLRENMGQPDHAKFAHTQPFAMAVGRDVFIQQFGYVHALHVGQQQRDVIHPLRLDAQGFFHVTSLAESRYCVQV